jgi:hypothetical protein
MFRRPPGRCQYAFLRIYWPSPSGTRPGGRYELAKLFDALPFGRVWYGEPSAISNAVGYAKFYSRSHGAVIHVYDDAGNVIQTLQRKGGVQGIDSG